MVWLYSLGGGCLALLAAITVWGFLHLRQSRRKALEETQAIELADIDKLTAECVKVFARKLSVQLNLEDCDDCSQKLDDAFRDPYKLKGAFARDDFYWYFVKSVGACLGELLRRHAHHQRQKRAGQAPIHGGGPARRPIGSPSFEKALQVQGGEAGELMAYVTFGRALARGELN